MIRPANQSMAKAKVEFKLSTVLFDRLSLSVIARLAIAEAVSLQLDCESIFVKVTFGQTMSIVVEAFA